MIVDLSDQLLSKQDANGIFQVLAEQYCALNANTPEKQQIGMCFTVVTMMCDSPVSDCVCVPHYIYR